VANDDARLCGWLVCIARCRETDLKRKQRSHAPLSGTEPARDLRERDERALLVRAAIDRLATTSAATAQLLERHFLDEVPVRELAKELGVTSGVVSARLSRAKKKLRAILEEMGGG
jgi:RNA polymerase sigma factor (sigma-70 family)